MPEFAQKARKDERYSLSSAIKMNRERLQFTSRLSPSRILTPVTHEDEADQPLAFEGRISEKHNQSHGFSLSNIRIFPDSSQLSGLSNSGNMMSVNMPPIRPVQAKLAINQPGDRYEQEADRIAEEVMRMPEPRIVNKSEMEQPPHIQRSCPKCKKKVSERRQDEEEQLQMKPASWATPESSAAQAMSSSAPLIVHEVLRSPGQPLDAATRAFMEPRFGHDFSRVRMHADARASESARAVNALAYTVGQDVVFGARQYTPHTNIGRKLIAHELAHVVQQAGQSTAPGGSLTIGAQETETEYFARRMSEGVGNNRYFSAQVNMRLPLYLAREQDVTSTGRRVTLRVSGDSVRRSPPGGIPIRNGTLSWELEYKGQPASVSTSGIAFQGVMGKDVEMHVTFTTGQGAGGCPTVTFIQIVRQTGGIQDLPHVLFTQETSGYSADVGPTETEPYYGLGGMPPGQGAGLTPDMSNTVAGTAPGRSQEATFADAPIYGTSNLAPGQTVVREFEVAAICVETGDAYGSVRWGYTKSSDGTIALTGAQASDVSAQSASPTVETARQAFYSGFFQYTLPGFARGSASLATQHRTTLREIASQPSARQIVLVGGNDFSGGPETDAALSLQRAEAAREYLIQCGVDPQRIRVEGHGVTAREPNPSGRQVAANRRVDIHIERGEEGLRHQTQGSALEGRRFRRQNPRETYRELVDMLLDLQSRPGPIPESACFQFTHIVDGLNRWRHFDPTVPDVNTHYGGVIRQLRQRCTNRIPRQRPEFELTPLQPPSFLERIEEATHELPF